MLSFALVHIIRISGADALSPPTCIFALLPTFRITVRELGTTHLELQNSCLLRSMSRVNGIGCFVGSYCTVGGQNNRTP